MAVSMRVLRAGYFNGVYPRVGDVLEVDDEYVAPLEQAQFAERVTAPGPQVPARRRPTKGAEHGTQRTR